MPEESEEDDESVWSVVVAVAVAAIGAVLVRADFCHHQTQCVEAGTCVRLHDWSCAFVTTTTPPGQRMLNASLADVLRGVCKPGLRQLMNVNGDVECRHRTRYPQAMELDIADSKNATDHERWCGRWIDAGVELQGQQLWAFEESAQVAREVMNAIDQKNVPVNDMKKFQKACNAMVTTNAQGLEAIAAYAFIESALTTGALEAVGVLSSFYCDAPAQVGVSFDGNGYVASVRTGKLPALSVIKAAAYALGINSFEREEIAAFARLMEQHGGTITQSEAAAVVRGSVSGTWVEPQMSAVFSASYEPNTPLLAAFVRASAETSPLPYLKGLAAVCALSMRTAVEGDLGQVLPLGRLRPNAKFAKVTADELFLASSRTWSAVAIESATRRTARSSCFNAAKFAFADALDRHVFNYLVTPRLYNTLKTMVGDIRTAATETLDDALIGSVFLNDAERNLAVAKSFQTQIRVAGAPPDSWAGSHAFQRPVLESKDGALLILLKQANAIFLDRMGRVARREDVCTHPPLFPATERNAYLLLSESFSCAVIMPGLLIQPFADERYDSASLYSRIGFVVAHELAHVTANRKWNGSHASYLLKLYNEQTWTEAIADVAAVAMVMKTHTVSSQELCAHVSQLWCGRVHFVQPNSHPPANHRGDALCAFLRENF